MATRISAWLAGTPFSSLDLSTSTGFWWLDRLRSAIVRAPVWLEELKRAWNVPEELSDESLGWLAAAALIETWPSGFFEFLDAYQTVDKHLSSATGVGRSFGLLLRDADRLEHAGYSIPAETLRTYLLSRYRRGNLTSKVTLFRGAAQRRRLLDRGWLSQTEASKRLGVRPAAIADLIRRGALSGNITPAGRKGRTVGVIDRDSVERLRERMTDSFTVPEVERRLGIERHRVLDLIQAGILSDAVRTVRGWRLARAALDEFLRWLGDFPISEPNRSDWISLREATRRFGSSGLNLVGIVQLLRDARIVTQRDPHDGSLRGLHFDLDDLRRLACEHRQAAEIRSGYSLNRLAGVLVPGRPLKEIVLRKWIRAGLLEARRQRKGWQISAAEVERFRTAYCLADEACRLSGVTRSTLARWETEGRLTAIYSRRTHRGAGASVFLRADIDRLLAARVA